MTAAEKMDRTGNWVGGSDFAALLNCETFKIDGVKKNPLHVYLDKIGEAGEQEESEPQFWGKEFEDGIAKRWASKNGVTVTVPLAPRS